MALWSFIQIRAWCCQSEIVGQRRYWGGGRVAGPWFNGRFNIHNTHNYIKKCEQSIDQHKDIGLSLKCAPPHLLPPPSPDVISSSGSNNRTRFPGCSERRSSALHTQLIYCHSSIVEGVGGGGVGGGGCYCWWERAADLMGLLTDLSGWKPGPESPVAARTRAAAAAAAVKYFHSEP